MLKNIHTNCQIEIMNEYDLHCRVVKLLRKKFPNLLLIIGLGELQDTSAKRSSAYNKGYRGGQPDLIIIHENEHYNGMAVEFKNPNGTGRLSSKQEEFLLDLQRRDYKVIVSNDYDEILISILEFMEIK